MEKGRLIEKFEIQYKDDSPFEKPHEIEKKISIEKGYELIYRTPENNPDLFDESTVIGNKPVDKQDDKPKKKKTKNRLTTK